MKYLEFQIQRLKYQSDNIISTLKLKSNRGQKNRKSKIPNLI